jgi:hypothetical protein
MNHRSVMLPAGCARHFELTAEHVYQSMSPDTQHGLKCSLWGRRWKKTLKASSSYRLLISFDEIFRLVFSQCGVGMDLWTFACIGHEVADLFSSIYFAYTLYQTTKHGRDADGHPIQGHFHKGDDWIDNIIHYNNRRKVVIQRCGWHFLIYLNLSDDTFQKKNLSDEFWDSYACISLSSISNSNI